MVSTLLPYTLNLEPPRTTQQPPNRSSLLFLHDFYLCISSSWENNTINSQVKDPRLNAVFSAMTLLSLPRNLLLILQSQLFLHYISIKHVCLSHSCKTLKARTGPHSFYSPISSLGIIHSKFSLSVYQMDE